MQKLRKFRKPRFSEKSFLYNFSWTTGIITWYKRSGLITYVYRKMADHKSRLHHLYRHFDKDNNLLYVGISINAFNRFVMHKAGSKWVDAVANVTIETFDTKREAKMAESRAIFEEKPKYNISENEEMNSIDNNVERPSKDEILEKIHNKEYRDSLIGRCIAQTIGHQIKSIRRKQGLTQGALAVKTDMYQNRISILEGGHYENHTLNILRRVASALDVALVVKFVPFSDLVEGLTTEDKTVPRDFRNDSFWYSKTISSDSKSADKLY